MNIERIILTSLSQVHPRLMTENVLWSEVRLETGETSLTDLRRHAGDLERKGQVVVITGEDATRLKITTDGIARLAE